MTSATPDLRGSGRSTTLTLATDAGAVREMHAAWRFLRESDGMLTPNAELERFLAVVDAIPRARPHVVLLERGGTPAGILVAREATRSIRCSLGYMTVPTPRLRCLEIVYGGVIARDDEARSSLTRHVAERLRKGRIQHAFFNELAEPSVEPMRAELAAAGCGTVLQKKLLHWHLDLVPGSFEETIGHFSRKHRYNLRRTDRQLVEAFDDDVRLRCLRQPEEVAELVESCARVAAGTFQEAVDGGFRDTPAWRAILQVEAAAGRLRGYLLLAKDAPIAFQIGVVYGRRYVLEATAFDPDWRHLSPGRVLLLRVLQDLCEAGLARLDYGFGDADYKRVHGTAASEERSLHAYGRGLSARVACLIDAGARRAHSAGERAAEGTGILGRLKRRWKRHLEHPG